MRCVYQGPDRLWVPNLLSLNYNYIGTKLNAQDFMCWVRQVSYNRSTSLSDPVRLSSVQNARGIGEDRGGIAFLHLFKTPCF